MAFATTVGQRGGDNLRKVLAEAEKSRRKHVKVGFFPDATYEPTANPFTGNAPNLGGEGVPVAYVAAIQEFGYDGPNASTIPERPFFRNAIGEINKDLPDMVRGILDTRTMTVGNQEANMVGAWAADIVQQSIRDLRTPPNSPVTIALKGSANPLIDTGYMIGAVSWEVG